MTKGIAAGLTKPELAMTASAILFAMSLPLMTLAGTHLSPLYYSATARAVNGALMIPAGLAIGRGLNVPWRQIARRPRAPLLLPVLGTQALALPAVTVATRYIAPTTIACILATYPIALVFLGWVATRGTPHPRQIHRRTLLAAAAGIGGAVLAITGQPAPAHTPENVGWLFSATGFACALAASIMIGMNAFSARFAIQNVLAYSDDVDDRAASAVGVVTIGVTGLSSAMPIAVVAVMTETRPAAPELGLAALNGITLTVAYGLWVTSTLRSRSLGVQIINYGEPVGALAILAATGLATDANWTTLIAGTVIVIGAGVVATIPPANLMSWRQVARAGSRPSS